MSLWRGVATVVVARRCDGPLRWAAAGPYGGCHPAELVEKTLVELDWLIEKVSAVDEWALCTEGTEAEVWSSTEGGSYTWVHSFNQRIGMHGNKFFRRAQPLCRDASPLSGANWGVWRAWSAVHENRMSRPRGGDRRF